MIGQTNAPMVGASASYANGTKRFTNGTMTLNGLGFRPTGVVAFTKTTTRIAMFYAFFSDDALVDGGGVVSRNDNLSTNSIFPLSGSCNDNECTVTTTNYADDAQLGYSGFTYTWYATGI